MRKGEESYLSALAALESSVKNLAVVAYAYAYVCSHDLGDVDVRRGGAEQQWCWDGHQQTAAPAAGLIHRAMTAAKAPFAKMKNGRPLRIMVLGQGGVGKSGRKKTQMFLSEKIAKLKVTCEIWCSWSD
jgi:hypothetical protein